MIHAALIFAAGFSAAAGLLIAGVVYEICKTRRELIRFHPVAKN